MTFDRIVLLALQSSAVMVAEWLRRWTRNPMGSPRTGSNPVYDALFCMYCIQPFQATNYSIQDAKILPWKKPKVIIKKLKGPNFELESQA